MEVISFVIGETADDGEDEGEDLRRRKKLD